MNNVLLIDYMKKHFEFVLGNTNDEMIYNIIHHEDTKPNPEYVEKIWQ